MRLTNAHKTTEIRAQVSREYRKEQFRKYHSHLVKKIGVFKSCDPKDLVKIINGTNSENHDASLCISSEMFLEHFKSLFNDTSRAKREDDRQDQDADHYDSNNEVLNKAFEEWKY